MALDSKSGSRKINQNVDLAPGARNLTTTGNITAGAFYGDGSHLTGISTASANDALITITAGGGLTGGGGFTVDQAADAIITVSHSDTSAQASVANTAFNVIQSITLDTYGHITAIESQDIGTAGFYVKTTGETGFGQKIGLGSLTYQTVQFFAGTGLSVVRTDNEIQFSAPNAANWNTAYNYSQVGHLPLSGGTLTGALTTGRVTISNNVSTGGFTSFNDYQILLYQSSTGFTQSYGIGIESDTMMFNSDTRYRFYVDNVVKATIESTGSLILTGGITASGYNNTNWDTAYGWGNHANAGYLTSVTNISGYAGTLLREDNRTISPSELTAGQMKYGFTSWNNNNTAPYADFLHFRSYTDSSGGADNLLTFRKDGSPAMRLWTQSWGSASAYSSYVDVITSGNIGSQSVNYATTAGSANSVAWGNVSSKPALWYQSGSWLADFASYSFVRENGVTMSGGSEFVLLSKSGQGHVLIDGSYWAGEQGGFYSLNTSNQYTSQVGFSRDSNAFAAFNTTVSAANDMRAPVFYDSNNTGYYVNPASTSIFDGLRLKGTNDQASGDDQILWIDKQNNYDWGVVITGNLEYGFDARMASSHSFAYRALKAGSEYFRVGSDLAYHDSQMRAPIFYDNNNTGYYLDPHATSNLNTVQVNTIRNDGSVTDDDSFGIYWDSSASTGYGIFRESGAWSSPFPDLRIAFHTGIKLGANAGYNGIRFYTDSDMATQVMSVNNGSDGYGAGHVYVNNIMHAGGSHRAPIFYDSNDTTYYTDPASGTNLRYLNVNGSWGASPFGSGHAQLNVTGSYASITQRSTVGALAYALHHIDDRYSLYVGRGATNGTDWDWALRAYPNQDGNYVEFRTSARAPIFYDSNNTGYYTDPASTSSLNEATFNRIGVGQGTNSSYRIIVSGDYYANAGGNYWAEGRFKQYRGSGTWHDVIDSGNIGSQSVSYATTARELTTNYAGGQQLNPQVYFNINYGLKVAMTAAWGYWSDTLWINGYAGGDVLQMCALHTQRNGQPRIGISVQASNSTSYGTIYELWSSYNMDAPNKSGTAYYQTNTWMQFNGGYGLYWPSQYGAHFYPNDYNSHGQFRLNGSKNGYGGIVDSYSGVTGIMYDSGGNGGVYREANGRWYFYHYVANNCTGINTSTTSSAYGLYVEKGIYSTGDITAYSDVRKKTNIVTIDSALDKVTKLRGVYYDRIDDLERGRQIGVIAQEVNEVLPEAVTYAEDIDEYGVKYGNIVGVLIEAIKEQQKQIEELKAIVDGFTK